jgi:hypothetical protein
VFELSLRPVDFEVRAVNLVLAELEMLAVALKQLEHHFALLVPSS